MPRIILQTKKAPAAIGPYSQAVQYGDLLFISGQIPLDPGTMKLVEGGVEEQTRRVMLNLQAILAEAGMSWDNILKTTIYLADMADFKTVNEIYGTFFPENAPARATVQVGRLPLDVRVEIDAIAGR